MRIGPAIALVLALSAACLAADDLPTIKVRADRITNSITPHMTGMCIEDVNHEIYGGIYSQMIFGESFAEPARAIAPKGFDAYGGAWNIADGRLMAAAGSGPKLISHHDSLASGEVGVELRFADKSAGLGGLIVKVNQPAVGADRWIGYEISLDPQRQVMVFGRHHNNWEPIKDVPCQVPVGQWIKLAAKISAQSLEVLVDGKSIYTFEGRQLPAGRIGLRTWQRPVEFRNLWVKTGDKPESLSFETTDVSWQEGVSSTWHPVRRGSAMGKFNIETADPFSGTQSQRIAFDSGEGEWGIENRGLNRQGMGFEAHKLYQGYVWIRSEKPADVFLAMESGDGGNVYGETKVHAEAGGWKRFDFALTPDSTDHAGRFAIKLKAPGSIVVGHVFLQPGEWGRFKGLPVRKDVVEGMLAQGVTVLRYGGSMVNAPQYRWKKMIGPRDRRPGYTGTWYDYSSNGWGIIDFLNLYEAMGIMGVPDFNIDETPQNMSDFVEYVNGPADSPWGKRRAADGHPQPYHLKHVELGNEEAVDEVYRAKFEKLAQAIWQKDPDLIPVIGDFEYKEPITDPHNFKIAPRITTLASHEKILQFVKARGKAVWFDVHIWNQSPGDCQPRLAALKSLADWLDKLVPGADFKICVFEENATNHAIRRALAHAETVAGLMRLGERVPIVCAANGLQVDGQNDNGWDQGLLFMNPWQAWNQPPGYVTQMISQNRLARVCEVEASGGAKALDVLARTDDEKKVVALQVMNAGDQPVKVMLSFEGSSHKDNALRVTQINGALNDVNTAAAPDRVTPQVSKLPIGPEGKWEYTLPARSFTVLRLE